jgi:hypothetical protein
MRRLDRGEIIRGISLKLQEEERERRYVMSPRRVSHAAGSVLSTLGVPTALLSACCVTVLGVYCG